VQALGEVANLEFVNGGGTGSVEATAADPAVTEITAGSGIFAGHLFNNYRSFSPAPAAAVDPDLFTIKSPIVGTFYRAPSPEAAPFVQEGDVVRKDSVVCIIEAMKIMNEIRAEVDGRIEKVLVEGGEPVEYGQPLFLVKKA
jgi:acetyl-CoA carboxylase biotin carboxyl carrier protein